MGTEILAEVEHTGAEGMLDDVEQEPQLKENVESHTNECSVVLDDCPEEVNTTPRSDSNPIVTSVQQKKVLLLYNGSFPSWFVTLIRGLSSDLI